MSWCFDGVRCRVVEGTASLVEDGTGGQCSGGSNYWLQDDVGDGGEALFRNDVDCWVLDSVGCWVRDDGEEASGMASTVGSMKNRTPPAAGVLDHRDTMRKASRSDGSERCGVKNEGSNPRSSRLLYPQSQLHRSGQAQERRTTRPFQSGQAPEPVLHELI
jgi:hypothetical protein